MGTIIELQITGVDYRDDDIIDDIHFNVPNINISVRNSLIVGVVEVDDPDLIVDKVLRCDYHLREVCAEASISRVYLDLVGVADISKRCGVSRQAVRKWTETNPFPSPAGLLGANDQKTWLWADVCDWLEDVKGLSVDDNRASASIRAAVEVALKRKRRVGISAPQKDVSENTRMQVVQSTFVSSSVLHDLAHSAINVWSINSDVFVRGVSGMDDVLMNYECPDTPRALVESGRSTDVSNKSVS